MAIYSSTIKGRAARRQTEAVVQVDFTGGLRLGSDGSILESNEVRQVDNIDFMPTGGFQRRKAVMPLTTLTSELDPLSDVIVHERDSGTELWFHDVAGEVRRTILDGTGNATAHAATFTGTGPLVGTQVGDNLVMKQSGATAWSQWSGSAATTLRQLLRTDNYQGSELPNFGEFWLTGTPDGVGVVSWNSRLWVWGAYLDLENGSYVWNGSSQAVWTPAAGTTVTADLSSAYFSFSYGTRPEEGPQDFYKDWSLKFEATGGPAAILTMVPVVDRMYVFDHDSIHVITPNFADPVELFYQVTDYRSRVGAVGKRAAIAAGSSCWFFDSELGLMEINAEGQLVSHSGKLGKDFTKTLKTDLTGVALGSWKGRVWVSVPSAVGDGTNDTTYVYDLMTQSWTKYSYGVDYFVPYTDNPGAPDAGRLGDQLIGFCGLNIVLLDHAGAEQHTHDFFAHNVSSVIPASVTTAWFDADSPETEKDWVGMEQIWRAMPGQQATITAYEGWNQANLAKTWVDAHTLASGASWGVGVTPDWAGSAPFTWSSYAPSATASATVYPAYTENNSLDAGLVASVYRTGLEQTGSLFGDESALFENEALANPVRFDRVCSSRSLSVKLDMTTNAEWFAFDRLTMFFERRPIRT